MSVDDEARQRDVHELRKIRDALEEETRILDLLNQTGAMLASKLDLQTLLQTVTNAATELSGAEMGAFFSPPKGPDGGAFELDALAGVTREALVPLGTPRLTPLFEPTFKGRRVVRIDDVLQDPRYGAVAPHRGLPAGHPPVRSYLAVPVLSRNDDVLGALVFGHPDPGVFTVRSERILVGIAAQAAIAIDNARLYEETKRAVEAERAARAEIERVSLLKDEFLATLSHELRTPLTAVLGWSGILLARVAADSEIRHGLDTIARNARAQVQMIEDLLDMNRIVSGKIRLEVQPVDLASVVDAAIDSVRPSAEAKSIRLRKVLDPVSWPVYGDPNRLQQVVWNLLTNAVKFTSRGGTVDVMLQHVSARVEIIVIDSGIGISAEFLPHLFDRFRQADASTTRKYGGLGLGLSIVKQLVELHGGAVRAQSEGPGTGAMFVVSLPVRPPREGGAPSPAPPERGLGRPEAMALAGVRVLVVDDQPDARRLLEMVLEDAQAQVVSAGSADEALALLSTARPDVIVSDISMPERDGYQLIRAIRARSPEEGGRIPAIALTAYARSEDRTRVLLAGFQFHIAKPIEPHELIVAIGSLAGRAGGQP